MNFSTRALELVVSDRLQEAEDLVCDELERNPADKEALLLAAEIALRKEDYPLSLQIFQQATSGLQGPEDLISILQRFYGEVKKTERATLLLEELLWASVIQSSTVADAESVEHALQLLEVQSSDVGMGTYDLEKFLKALGKKQFGTLYTIGASESFSSVKEWLPHFLVKELPSEDEQHSSKWQLAIPKMESADIILISAGQTHDSSFVDSKVAWSRLRAGGFLIWNQSLSTPADIEYAFSRGILRFQKDFRLPFTMVSIPQLGLMVMRKPLPPAVAGNSKGEDYVLKSDYTRIEFIRSKRFFIVFPGADEKYIAAQKKHISTYEQHSGFKLIPYPVPCEGGWWKFEKLDREWRAGNSSLLQSYAQLAKELKPDDIVVCCGGSMMHPDFVRSLPNYTVMICADDPESSSDLSRPVASAFDCCLPVNVAVQELYWSWSAKQTSWIFPLVESYFFLNAVSKEEIFSKVKDVPISLFCERVYNLSNRADRIEQLVKLFPETIVRGQGWPGGFISQEEMIDICRRTKIGWNLHNGVGPVNTRALSLPFMGIMQICDNKSYLSKMFELDREVVGFESLEECIEKTRYYLAHEEERQEIAYRGWERARKDYTYKRYWERMALEIFEGYAAKIGVK